jgi:hypothetical protein
MDRHDLTDPERPHDHVAGLGNGHHGAKRPVPDVETGRLSGLVAQPLQNRAHQPHDIQAHRSRRGPPDQADPNPVPVAVAV